MHRIGLRCGFHILPVHYYTSVPNVLELEKTRDLWAKPSAMPGVRIDLDQQIATLQKICLPYQHEYAGNKAYLEGMAKHFGPGYGYIEAQALHSVIRHFKPRRIIEVGCGVSTFCMIKALERNEQEGGQAADMTCIEPYPSKPLRKLRRVHLIEQKAQTVSFDVFGMLRENDFLFIDSSHTVKTGGDVNFLILEVLPRLQPGVIVHFHDIFFPYDYQRSALTTLFHWSETSLLHAYLIHNKQAGILFSLSHLHYDRKQDLQAIFPEYIPQADNHGLQPEQYKAFDPIPAHFPGSTYIRMST